MAAATMGAPGTDFGPCAGDCEHTDCAIMRSRAAEPCTMCGKPIGYETRYYSDERMNDFMGFAHARCVESLGEEVAS